ncbi:MAG: NAD-dependent epimerase/dehydratase family protein [Deltaproteobacteria bacterium]|nr:NAD-dependent epimerase/dehydratase family protein [Deltaproteobacteria bacterium]
MERVFVSGGTGFLGSHLARALADAGHDVTVFGRNLYAQPRVFHPRIARVRGDLRDRSAVVAAVAGHALVFHSGALSTPWGTRADFDAINVQGTRNIIEASIAAGVRRLVHVSSTSVHFDPSRRKRGDVRAVKESDALPSSFVNDYARSKHEAEQLVLKACAQGLDAVIVRARAIIGPGDTTILPRILEAARKGRLRQIGKGDNQLDLTWIGNLVDALLLCRDRGASGEVFTITNDEPRAIWPLLRDLLKRAGIEHELKPISAAVVDKVAAVVEGIYRALPFLGEPTLTRYGAALLAHTQTFDIDKAKTQLGYQPKVSLDEALTRTMQHLTQTDERRPSSSSSSSSGAAGVRLRLLFTGFTQGYEHHVLQGARREIVPFHSMVAVVEHPLFGVTLFDSGYSRHFHEHTRRFPFSVYARVTPVTCVPDDEVKTQLARLGIPHVDRVVISHFHGDHIAGLRDFDDADLLVHHAAWSDARSRSGINAVRKGHVPGLLPDDFASRVYALPAFADPGFGPFARAHDLFGDRSVLLVELPGHAAGQVGMLVQLEDGTAKLLVADAVWYSLAIRERRMPGAVTRPLFSSTKDYRRTLETLHAFAERFPAIELLPTHCPEVFARYSSLNGEVIEAPKRQAA